jgi:hypothetical protein
VAAPSSVKVSAIDATDCSRTSCRSWVPTNVRAIAVA